jgi:putative ABC transport system substrate-binding protein
MQAGDPVATGVVASLARPGGNVTGMSSTTAELGGKLLELVREVLPGIKKIGVLWNRTDPFSKPFLKQIEEPAAREGIEISAVGVTSAAEYDGAFAALLKLRAEAVVIQPSLQRPQVVELALKHRLAPFAPSSPFADDGALLAYSAKLTDVYRTLAVYVDKILKGAKPADLPIQQPTVFELAVNQKTAKALGLTIPRSILARADRVIE